MKETEQTWEDLHIKWGGFSHNGCWKATCQTILFLEWYLMIFGRIAHLQNTSFNVAHLAAPIASLLLELSWRKTSCADFLGGGSMGNPSSMLSDVNVSPIWQHPLFPYLFGGGGFHQPWCRYPLHDKRPFHKLRFWIGCHPHFNSS